MSVMLGFNANDIIRKNLVEKEDVDEITQWIKEEKLPLFTDEQIIQFLLSSDNCVGATKKTIKAYVEITNNADELFSNRNIKRIDLKKFQKSEIFIVPERTEDGCMVLFNRLVDTNYRNFYMGPYFIVFSMVIDAGLYDYPANGLIAVVDLTGISWKHLACLRFGLIRTFTHYLQEGLPVKLRKIYLINARPIVDRFISTVRPFMRQEVLDKIEIHRIEDMSMFYKKCLSQRFLPVDYGGEMPCAQVLQRRQEEKFKTLIPYFEAGENQRKTLNF